MSYPTHVGVSILAALAAGPHALVSPARAFSANRDGRKAWLALVGVVFLTALAATISNRPTAAILQSAPGVAASPAFARAFTWTQSVILTPIGTAAFLLSIATTVWGFALLLVENVTFSQSASIVFMAGIVGVLKQIFVAAVLYTRWWFWPSTLGDEITTGLDGFVPQDLAATFPISVLRETGLFEVWFFALVAMGLEYSAGRRRRVAVGIAGATAIVFIGAKVLMALVTPK